MIGYGNPGNPIVSNSNNYKWIKDPNQQGMVAVDSDGNLIGGKVLSDFMKSSPVPTSNIPVSQTTTTKFVNPNIAPGDTDPMGENAPVVNGKLDFNSLSPENLADSVARDSVSDVNKPLSLNANKAPALNVDQGKTQIGQDVNGNPIYQQPQQEHPTVTAAMAKGLIQGSVDTGKYTDLQNIAAKYQDKLNLGQTKDTEQWNSIPLEDRQKAYAIMLANRIGNLTKANDQHAITTEVPLLQRDLSHMMTQISPTKPAKK